MSRLHGALIEIPRPRDPMAIFRGRARRGRASTRGFRLSLLPSIEVLYKESHTTVARAHDQVEGNGDCAVDTAR